MHFIINANMSISTRVTRSKGKSDRLSLPTRTRPTRKETLSGRSGGMVLNTTFNVGRDQQQQMPTQMPQLLTQSPMLPPGPHRPLTPRKPLPASPTLVHGHLPLCSKRTSTAQPQKKKQKRTQK